MKGNKGQHGTQWAKLQVNTKKGICTVLKTMTDEEYEQSGKDYKNYFTLKDSAGNLFTCSRAEFKVPRYSAD